MLREGVRLDRWIVEEVVGEGAAAVVYRALEPTSGDQVALKVPLQNSPGALARFAAEARCHRRVRHPNVVGVRGELVAAGTRILVLDHVEGPTLADFLRGASPREDHAPLLAKDLVSGLAAVHAAGVVHRDLKPSNILLDLRAERPTARITDFGVARLLSDPPSVTEAAVIGTPGYMAPEQFRDPDRVGPAADVFSLGVVLYELYCGMPPFTGDSFRTLNDIVAMRYIRPHRLVAVDPAKEAAIVGALIPDPARRIPDCSSFWRIWTGAAEPPTIHRETEEEARSVWLRPAPPADTTLVPDDPVPRTFTPTTEEVVAPPILPPRSFPWSLLSSALALVMVAFLAFFAARQAPAEGLHLRTDPAGARVYADGTLLGLTPTVVAPGRRVVIELDGYVVTELVVGPEDLGGERTLRLVPR